MDLTNQQIKDTYGNVLTIGTTAGSPTTGTLQNGEGLNISSFTFGSYGSIVGTGGYALAIYGGGQSWLPNLGIVVNLGFGPAFSSDTFLTRDGGSGLLAQRNSTNAQTFNIYNTYTDGSNYERGFLKWDSNVLEIGTEALGTGTARITKFLTVNAAAYDQPQFKLASYDTGIALSGNDDVFIVCNGIVNASFQNSGADRLIVWNGSGSVGFSAGEATSSPDTSFSRSAAGVMGVRANNATTGGSLEFLEQTAPSAGGATSARIFAQDNGSGKTQLMVQFGSGAAQQIAIEP